MKSDNDREKSVRVLTDRVRRRKRINSKKFRLSFLILYSHNQCSKKEHIAA